MERSPKTELDDLNEALIDGWMIDHEPKVLIEKLAETCTWISAGREEILTGKKAIITYLEAMAEEKTKRPLKRGSYTVILAEAGYGLVSIECLPMRYTILWVKEGSKWQIRHLHDSLYIYGETMHERLKIAARTDTVTKLHNQQGFCDAVSELMKAHDKRYALIKFGIKDFRYINQRYGYAKGEAVLQNIGKNLQKTCEADETCGHIEKDIFAMLYRYHGKQDMARRMEEVRHKLLDKHLLYELGIEIDFIAGIYTIPKGMQEHVKDMLDKALMAQQQVSRQQIGSHYRYYEESVMRKQYQHQQLIQYAPTAMKKDEFLLYIQPQFSISCGKIVAGEALCRWKSRDGTFIPPDEFIPLFEEYGLICAFDFYMLKKLCEKMKAWMERGRIITPISINQSRLHIDKKDYIERFCKVVDHYEIPHSYIAFELTESAFVEQYEKMIRLAGELHRQGFQLAIDDFGTGFASLNLLSVVSADILKVDKSLLDSIHTKRGRTVLEKVIELAHQMEMTVICEGIEEETQLKELRELKCDIGQGYLMGRPIPAEAFEKRWIEGNEETKG